MSKIIKLTESELMGLVKKIIKENTEIIREDCIKKAQQIFVRLTEKNDPCSFSDSSSFAQFIIEEVISNFDEDEECYDSVEDYCWNDMGDMCILIYNMYCGE